LHSNSDLPPRTHSMTAVFNNLFAVKGRNLQRPIRLLVVDNQPIHPPVGGGRVRLHGLYSHLPEHFHPLYVGTYDWPGEDYREVQHGKRLREITVPQSEAHFQAHDALSAVEDSVTVDVTFPLLAPLSTEFCARVRAEALRADVVVVSHPWCYPVVSDVLRRERKPLVYDSHNVESLVKQSLIGTSVLGSAFARLVTTVERELCTHADAILACSAENGEAFVSAYAVGSQKIHVVPNGVDTAQIVPASLEQRQAARHHLALPATGPVAVFIGSNYPPNADAVLFICTQFAPAFPQVTFVVVGGCGSAMADRALPPNVRVLGMASDEERGWAYHAADFGLNPMSRGSGTNIKMLDFFAAGLPSLTTPVGARGLRGAAAEAFFVADLGDFGEAFERLLLDQTLCRHAGAAARRLAMLEYDWSVISSAAAEAIESVVQTGGPSAGDTSERERRDLRLAMLTTWNTRCGIADYSGFLASALPRDLDLKIYADRNSSTPDSPAVRLNWKFGLEDPSDVVSSLRADRRNVLLLQHNPAFYPLSSVAALLEQSRAAGVRTAITLHAAPAVSKDPAAARALSSADLVFVHRHSDAALVGALGGNTRVVPQGVPAFPFRTREQARELIGLQEGFVVAHFGFLRPHKGTAELIDAFDLVAASVPSVRLLLSCSRYPSPDSRDYEPLCLERIAASSYADRISASFDHLEIEAVAILLQAADLIVLPYKASSESSSAAARIAVASGRAVLVSQSAIFEDLSGVAETAGLETPADIATAIIELARDPERLEKCARRVRGYAGEHSWQRVVQATLSHLHSIMVP
jgi:glycosyltransferase involved in cell wall biosynthesis